LTTHDTRMFVLVTIRPLWLGRIAVRIQEKGFAAPWLSCFVSPKMKKWSS